MSSQPAYKRILLKLSGETLKGSGASGIDADETLRVAHQVKALADLGVEIALVLGAGNLFRGLAASRLGMTRATADYMGMLATVMNALAMQDALQAVGVPARVQSALPMPGVVDAVDRRQALDLLAAGTVVLFAGGTGHPFFTTDTTAALRACEVEATAILKATKVPGVFTADPFKDPAARRYRCLTFQDALAQRLGVMDATAFALCQENNIPILVFDFFAAGSLCAVACGDLARATEVGAAQTILADDL